MPRDFGFAPNPFFGVCTLACCKPNVRRSAQPGDLVIGLNGQPPSRRPKQHEDRIVYVMRVTEAATFNAYWEDPRFQCKKPSFSASRMFAFGDNIYRKDEDGRWFQMDSHHSLPNGEPNDKNIETDTSADRVLISTDFVYWGGLGPLQRDLRDQPWASSVFDGGRRGEKTRFENAVVDGFDRWFVDLPVRGCVGRPERWISGAAGQRR
jgi:hypothetical protein